MKIREEYKVREMAGEHVVIMQGRLGVDMTKIISLNVPADFASTLEATAARDAAAWVEKLRDCKLI